MDDLWKAYGQLDKPLEDLLGEQGTDEATGEERNIELEIHPAQVTKLPLSQGIENETEVEGEEVGAAIFQKRKRDSLEMPKVALNAYKSKKRRTDVEEHKEPLGTNELGHVPPLIRAQPPHFILDIKHKRHQRDSKLENRVPSGLATILKGHRGGVNRMKWCRPDAHLLASCGVDKTVRIWHVFGDPPVECDASDAYPESQTGSAPSGMRKTSLAVFRFHTEAVKDVEWNHDSSQILSCGFDKTVKRVDVESGQCIRSYAHTEYTTAIKYHPWQHHLFVAGGYRHGVVCWDIRTNTVVKQFNDQFGQVLSLEFINDGKELLTSSDITKRNSLDKAILVWDFGNTSILSNQVYQEAYTCTALKAHPSTNFFCAQSNGGYIAIFNAKKPYKLNRNKRFEGHSVSGYNIGFDICTDGSLVGTGSANGKVYLYNWYSTKIAKILNAHSNVTMDVAFHPLLPTSLASCSWDGEIKVWE